MTLENKTAIVTGGSRGIGRAICVALAQAGAKVLGVARRSCDETKAKIEEDGGVFAEVIADLSEMSSIDKVIKQGEGGKIINVCSMLSYQGGIRVPSYTASKSAVIGLTRAMANEWAKYNINVNGIAPGYMATNNTAQLRDDADRSEAILDRIPAGRWGTPEDMQGAVVYLASKASDYVDGFTLAVDGGWLAR